MLSPSDWGGFDVFLGFTPIIFNIARLIRRPIWSIRRLIEIRWWRRSTLTFLTRGMITSAHFLIRNKLSVPHLFTHIVGDISGILCWFGEFFVGWRDLLWYNFNLTRLYGITLNINHVLRRMLIYCLQWHLHMWILVRFKTIVLKFLDISFFG